MERDETEEWIGVSGMSFRRRSRRGRREEARGRRVQIGNRCNGGDDRETHGMIKTFSAALVKKSTAALLLMDIPWAVWLF